MTVMEEKATSVPSRTKDIAFSGGLREWGSRNLIIQSGSQEQMLAFFLRAPGVMLMLGYGAGITTNAINVVSIHERRQMIVKTCISRPERGCDAPMQITPGYQVG